MLLRPGSTRLLDVRRALSQVAHDDMGWSPDWLTLTATELVCNALAAAPPDGRVELTLHRLDGGGLELQVADDGPGPPPLPASPPSVDQVRGRGLFIVQELSDGLWFERVDGCTIAHARKLPPHPTA